MWAFLNTATHNEVVLGNCGKLLLKTSEAPKIAPSAVQAMSTLCWIAFYAVVKNTPAWCEQKWPKTAVIFPLESNPCSSLLTSVSVRFSVYTTQESAMKTYPICDDSLQGRSSAASLRRRNRSEIGVLCVNKSPIR